MCVCVSVSESVSGGYRGVCVCESGGYRGVCVCV